MTSCRQTDLLVIGAGFSGLHAARLARRRGFSVCVLEARKRVGGRAERHRFGNGDTVDIGGQWVGPGQERLYRLIREMGLATYPLYHAGDHLLKLGRRLRRYRGLVPPLAPHELIELHLALSRFEKLAASVDPDRPWTHPNAERLDRMTLDEWMRRNLRMRRTRRLFAIGIAAVFAASPEELSLLHALFYARAGGSLRALLDVEDGAQQDRVHGDMAGLAEAVAQAAREEGVEIRLASPVGYLEWSPGRATAHTPQGAVEARCVICALPPNQLRRIRFAPALPARRDRLWQRMPAGRAIKCIAQYRQPFWRNQGLSGEAVGGSGPIEIVFDNTEAGRSAGLLMGFISGPAADRWGAAPDDERRAAVLRSFAEFFGTPALEPIDYVDRDWGAQEWTRGCYTALMGPGVWTSYGEELRAPIGPLHFAGTETACRWHGYFEGALEAAERSVREVAATLADT